MSESSAVINEWPLPAFHFQVTFDSPAFQTLDIGFQEVSGLETKIEVEEYREGGHNNFTYHLPKAVTHTNLILKRSIAPSSSPLVTWCRDTFSKDFVEIKLLNITVSLLDEEGNPVRTWSFFDVYPVSWKTESFHATKNEVAIEEIQLCYSHGKRD
ncbi:MAG: phage tail protein [Psychromonas sp.]